MKPIAEINEEKGSPRVGPGQVEKSQNKSNGKNGTETPSLFEELRNEVAQGLLYSHSRANANTSKVLEVASFSYALMELLMERGMITVDELDERKKIIGQRLVEKFVEKGMGVALTTEEKDKYSHDGEVQIDCENRLHLCHAACCRLRFALSVQDVEEGKVKWELGHPYMIRQGADGYCHHFERKSCQCSIYASRPMVCRSYDCRGDKRIWSDFDNKIPSPELEKLFTQKGDTKEAPRAQTGSAQCTDPGQS